MDRYLDCSKWMPLIFTEYLMRDEVMLGNPKNIAGFLESIRRVVTGIFHEAIGLAQYVYEECFVKGNSLEDIMPGDPRTQKAITAVYMLYMDEQNADESDEITS